MAVFVLVKIEAFCLTINWLRGVCVVGKQVSKYNL